MMDVFQYPEILVLGSFFAFLTALLVFGFFWFRDHFKANKHKRYYVMSFRSDKSLSALEKFEQKLNLEDWVAVDYKVVDMMGRHIVAVFRTY